MTDQHPLQPARRDPMLGVTPDVDPLSSETYPAAIGVCCDRCGTTVHRDFLVSDDMDQDARFAVARKHLASYEGWSCTEVGDFCPACRAAALAPTSAEQRAHRAESVLDEVRAWRHRQPQHAAPRFAELDQILDQHAVTLIEHQMGAHVPASWDEAVEAHKQLLQERRKTFDHLNLLWDQVEARLLQAIAQHAPHDTDEGRCAQTQVDVPPQQ